ncbi:histidine kinase dimerization/phospho-acceptor domain-containing protein [Candidatus Latescibacterota bacterium]
MPDKYEDQWSLQVLYEIIRLIRADGNLEDKFIKTVEMIKDAIECDSVSLFLYNNEKQCLEEAVTMGIRVNPIDSTKFEMEPDLNARVAKKCDSALHPNVTEGSTGVFKSFISMPLLIGDILFGVLNIGHTEPDYFNEKHRHFLDIIVGEFSGTIEHSRIKAEINEKNSALALIDNKIMYQEKQLDEMEKYKTLIKFAASINHEINNPLTSIIGNIELLLMKYTDMDKQMEKKLKVVLNESRRIADILNKLRDIKKNTERLSEKNGEENLS